MSCMLRPTVPGVASHRFGVTCISSKSQCIEATATQSRCKGSKGTWELNISNIARVSSRPTTVICKGFRYCLGFPACNLGPQASHQNFVIYRIHENYGYKLYRICEQSQWVRGLSMQTPDATSNPMPNKAIHIDHI